MLNIAKEKAGDAIVIRLTGSIEESVDFAKSVGPIDGSEVHVNVKGVTRINSVGVKAWIQYFQGLSSKGLKLKFVECSTAIVEQINLISNFLSGGEILSIYVPFSCESCKTELVGLFKVDALRQIGDNIPNLKCSKCGGSAVFDDIPEEYFGFLSKST